MRWHYVMTLTFRERLNVEAFIHSKDGQASPMLIRRVGFWVLNHLIQDVPEEVGLVNLTADGLIARTPKWRPAKGDRIAPG